MPIGRRRKIEVATDTQSQFELGDRAEDIERRREREERREEKQERGEKRTRTDMDTDVQSTQARQKNGQIKSIVLSDSKKSSWSLLNGTTNFMTRPTTVSKTSRRKKDFGRH